MCFRCLGRDCRDNLVSLEELASQACYEEAPAGPKDDSDDEQELAPITFAQIVKETNFTQKREARKKFAEQKQKEKVVQERVLEERRDRQRRKEGFSISRGSSIEREVSSDWAADSWKDSLLQTGTEKTKRHLA